MSDNKRVIIVRLGILISMILFMLAFRFYVIAEGAKTGELIFKYKQAYWVTIGVTFMILLGLAIFQIVSHKKKSSIEVSKDEN